MKLPMYALLLAGTLAMTVACGKVSQGAQPQGSAGSGTATAPTGVAPFSTRPDAGNGAGASPSAAVQPLQIPSGTALSVRLQSSISSASALAGDGFHAVLDSPLRVDGQTVAPAGAEVTGKVVAAEKSGRLEHPGMIQLELNSIQIGGTEVAIRTSRVTARGASHKTRNLSWIGGGAGGGALLGGLMGGGKGAVIGSLAGAGAGTATAAATGKHDVAFNAEHQMTFRLRQQVEVR